MWLGWVQLLLGGVEVEWRCSGCNATCGSDEADAVEIALVRLFYQYRAWDKGTAAVGATWSQIEYRVAQLSEGFMHMELLRIGRDCTKSPRSGIFCEKQSGSRHCKEP